MRQWRPNKMLSARIDSAMNASQLEYRKFVAVHLRCVGGDGAGGRVSECDRCVMVLEKA